MSFKISFARLLDVVQKSAKFAYTKERVCLSWIPEICTVTRQIEQVFETLGSVKVHMDQPKKQLASVGYQLAERPTQTQKAGTQIQIC